MFEGIWRIGIFEEGFTPKWQGSGRILHMIPCNATTEEWLRTLNQMEQIQVQEYGYLTWVDFCAQRRQKKKIDTTHSRESRVAA